MKIFNSILIAIIALLSIAAGLAKLMQVPEEIKFLESFGFSIALISTYGICQILGGVLLVLPKTRVVGAIVTIVAFTLSTVLIFISGKFTFGLVSIVPIVLVSMVVLYHRKFTQDERINSDSL